MTLLANNKKAYFDYFIIEKIEAGIVLTGTEIKSVRLGKVNIKDAYATIKNEEIYILGMHIAKYALGNRFNHDETRTRKLLLRKKQISSLIGSIKREQMTLIPLKIYLKKGFAKIELGLAKGKKLHDKREDIKKKDAKRAIEKALKNNYKE